MNVRRMRAVSGDALRDRLIRVLVALSVVATTGTAPARAVAVAEPASTSVVAADAGGTGAAGLAAVDLTEPTDPAAPADPDRKSVV